MTGKKILDGHKKVGSKFVPPVMQIKGLAEISYINRILPEILWMGLILDHAGKIEGNRLIFDFAQKAFDLRNTKIHANFALASSYSHLSHDSKKELLGFLKDTAQLNVIAYGLMPLMALYERFPLSFLMQSDMVSSQSKLLERLRNATARYFYKFENPALIIIANIRYIREITGGIGYATHIKRPDYNVLITDPESEEAERTGAFLRSAMLMEFMPGKQALSDSWARDFWNQSYYMDRCIFLNAQEE